MITRFASRYAPPETIDAVDIMRQAGLEPDPWQRDLLEARPARGLLNTARQTGKSTVAAAMSIREAIVDEGSVTLMVSPSQRQSSELLGRVRSLLSRLPDPPAISGESALQLRFENGSRILSLPGKEGTVRGYTASTLIVDEGARVPDELLEAVRPMLAASGGRLISMSTPWGRRGWFYEAWVGPGAWYRVEVPASQCSRISPEFLAEEKATLPAPVYEAEYCCIFGDPEGAAFAADDIEAMWDSETELL